MFLFFLNRTPLTSNNESNYFRMAWTGCGFVKLYFSFNFLIFFLSVPCPAFNWNAQLIRCNMVLVEKLKSTARQNKTTRYKIPTALHTSALQFCHLKSQNESASFSVVLLKVGTKAVTFSETKGWLSQNVLKIAMWSSPFVIVLSPECRFDRQSNDHDRSIHNKHLL